MDGERKFIVVVVSLAILCITIMYCLLFFALWQYKVIVGVSLLVSLLVILLAGTFSVCIVAVRGNPHRQLSRSGYYPHVKQESQSTYNQPPHPWYDKY